MKYASSPRRICASSYEYVSGMTGKSGTLPMLSIMSPSSQSQEY